MEENEGKGKARPTPATPRHAPPGTHNHLWNKSPARPAAAAGDATQNAQSKLRAATAAAPSPPYLTPPHPTSPRHARGSHNVAKEIP